MGVNGGCAVQRARVTLVWIVLVAALVATVAIFAVVLFRKFLGVLSAFSDLVGQTAVLDGVHRAEVEERPTPAVLGPVGAASTGWSEATHRRRRRRLERRTTRLRRAKLLVRPDAASIERFRR